MPSRSRTASTGSGSGRPGSTPTACLGTGERATSLLNRAKRAGGVEIDAASRLEPRLLHAIAPHFSAAAAAAVRGLGVRQRLGLDLAGRIQEQVRPRITLEERKRIRQQ